MKQTIGIFQGFHDFVSFADKRMDKEASTKVNIEGLWLQEFDDIIALRIVGSHFLWKMVRRITGVTVETGRNNLTKRDVEKMFLSLFRIEDLLPRLPVFFWKRYCMKGDKLPEIKPLISLS